MNISSISIKYEKMYIGFKDLIFLYIDLFFSVSLSHIDTVYILVFSLSEDVKAHFRLMIIINL